MHNAKGGTPAARVGALRVTWQAEWRHNEIRRGVYAWRDLDAELAAAKAAGIRDVLLMIGLTPGWATAAGSSKADTVDPPAALRDWDRWVHTVTKRYSGRGYSYQIWNEANLRRFWTGTPELMATLTARAYPIIKRNDPTAKVVAPSTTTRLTDSFHQYFPRFLARLRSYRWPVDVFTAHMYPPGTGTPTDVQNYLGKVKAMLRAARAPARPIWNTEVNYGLAGPGTAYPHVTITGNKAAAWLARTYLDSIRLGVQRAYWYMQAPPDPLLGIQMWTGQSALVAERTVYAWLVGARWRGCTRAGAVHSCITSRAGRTATIVWTDGPRATVLAPVGTTVRCDARNRCTPTKPGERIMASDLPVRIGSLRDS